MVESIVVETHFVSLYGNQHERAVGYARNLPPSEKKSCAAP